MTRSFFVAAFVAVGAEIAAKKDIMTKQEIGVRVQRVAGTSRIWTRTHSTTPSAISIAKATPSGMIGSMSPGYLASAANRVRAFAG